MTDHESEAFDLPAWGTAGAPPAPPDTDDAPATPPPDLFFEVEPELITSTGPLPDRYRVGAVIGLVTSEGAATITEDVTLADAVGAARSAALDRLSTEAAMLNADAVTEIRLETVTRLNDVVVCAAGTAVELGRS